MGVPYRLRSSDERPVPAPPCHRRARVDGRIHVETCHSVYWRAASLAVLGAVGRDRGGKTMRTAIPLPVPSKRAPWNKGRLIGQKRPLKPRDVSAIRVRLQLQGPKRDLALFNLAIDSELRGCDLLASRSKS